MGKIAIEFQNISKQYALGSIGTGTLSRDLNRWWARIRGKEDPYLRIGEENDRSKKATGDFVWALKDINFHVEEGEVLGIIGKNGAGKSTLLKILSRVTSPTAGCIRARGRIASLLEVGTGFHPEMTGRENIYMNGSIMGMTKAEITRKLDEIVAFAGVEKYIDTPVKRYSSGMTVRLGFAIAAHLEPEILVVDEVLAVGDAEFQKKAIGKMQDVSKGEGRTVLFVSHNMAAVRSLCTKGICLENGTAVYQGTVHSAIDYYLKEKGTVRKSKIIDYVGWTKNTLHIGANGEMSRKLNFKDVMGFSILRKNGYRMGIISGEKNSAIEIISKKFNVEEVHQGIRVKIDVIKSIVERYNLSEEEFVYIGDDINDYDSLTYAKYRVTVPDAVDKIKNIKDIQITEARGGDGAFREVVDALISTSVGCKHKF